MIVPVAGEEAWLTVLGGVPEWVLPVQPTLVVAPHPDDETLGAGGLIASLRARDVPVRVAAVTDGEAAYGDDARGLGAVRRVEQAQALERLGVGAQDILRFGLPDSSVSACEERLADRLATLISRETHVVAPWTGDFHPDHEACGRAAQRVAAQCGAKLSFYFFWTWHRGTPELLEKLRLRALPLTTEVMVRKAEALACHRSQLEWSGGEPVLRDELLAPARRPFEVFVEPAS